MLGDNRLQIAAMVAANFHLDPIVVLEADYFDWIVRIAATEHYLTVKKQAEEAAQNKRK